MRLAWAVLVLAGLVLACGKKEAPAPAAAADFVVLATSDLRDVQPLEAMVLKATGVKLKFRFGGTMESTEAVLTGQADAAAAWFANAKYLLSNPQGQQRVKLQEKTMLSPIAVGVSQSDARKFGWDKPDLKMTWKDIATAAKAGQLKYAISNPATSNQGFLDGRGGGRRWQVRGAVGERCRPRSHRRLLEGLQDHGRQLELPGRAVCAAPGRRCPGGWGGARSGGPARSAPRRF
jgi:hypothetical protein